MTRAPDAQEAALSIPRFPFWMNCLGYEKLGLFLAIAASRFSYQMRDMARLIGWIVWYAALFFAGRGARW